MCEEDFKRACSAVDVMVDDSMVELIFALFDHNDDGNLMYEEFIQSFADSNDSLLSKDA